MKKQTRLFVDHWVINKMEMRKTIYSGTLLALLLLAVGVTSVHAQTAVKGAIRGAVYRDTNADGICGPGDPALADVQIDFTLEGGQTIRLLTFSDGTYGLASIALGTWQVTAWPLAGWVVTSQQPVVVVLTSEQNTAENVNFCMAPQSASGGGGSTTLPESGAFAPPTLLVAAVISLFLMLVGAGLLVLARQMSR